MSEVLHLLGNGSWTISEKPRKTTKILPSGAYELNQDQFGRIFINPMDVKSDELINLPNTASNTIINEVNQFWSGETRKMFDHFNLVYKRGILMHGKPGTGKTSTSMMVIKEVIKLGGVVFFNPPVQIIKEVAIKLQKMNPNTKILVIWEEFDSLCDSATMLSILDGELQVDNIVYLATTNYINRIPERIKNRPSRFSSVYEVGYPNEETRRIYLVHKLSDLDLDIEQWVKLTDGLSIDHLKDLIVSVCCFNVPLKESVEKLRSMENIQKEYSQEQVDWEENF